jgi:hypothetical protein
MDQTHSSVAKIANCMPKMSDDELFVLFGNAAAKMEGGESVQAEAVLAHLGVEWARRHNSPTYEPRRYGVPDIGMLKRLGYCVGGKSAVSTRKRRLVLGAVFSQPLPFWHSPSYSAAWGAPSSLKRYIKIRNCIETFIANAENNDADKFARAIREWAEDLEWLQSEIESFGRIRG